ncbi:uncharacterized protein MONOS_14468 [Monocercomonoides exilis]|uniref:uncharacterized protein n=1 Tax=Monocercomonoides exilis TaxID=2049356 RepID=UPI00355966D4|nr:hypothetical protein MONOS_14468 [Monocercomonoides exilis]|eukprot:MONOS_14468.1-p1 / transcript=MONOS_14468.1 / gene=MONOS_14468 / organism=Monocercomonoides_exilis_PA203 / gene_product=unspecified product / transcript_product=unspecified product / location=Mono_scaffold01007:6118-8441(+) / protein_length=729 / sequence_SO=supercontig / SO=protein_coding / is_pseudo=false
MYQKSLTTQQLFPSSLFGTIFFGLLEKSNEIRDLSHEDCSTSGIEATVIQNTSIDKDQLDSNSLSDYTPSKRKTDSVCFNRRESEERDQYSSSDNSDNSPTELSKAAKSEMRGKPEQLNASSNETKPKKKKGKIASKRNKLPDFNSLKERRDLQLEEINQMEIHTEKNEDDSETYGVLFDSQLNNPDDEHLRQTIDFLIELGNLVQSEISSIPKQGPKKRLTTHDEIVVCLEWLSSKTTFKRIAFSLGISESMTCNSIKNIRPFLLNALEKMFINPPRPQSPLNEDYPQVALLVDATTIKVSTPPIPFEDSKLLYDGHHQVCSLKFEVAVSALHPHKALFVSNAVMGGVHDVALYREGKERCVQYLKMADKEKEKYFCTLYTDRWAIVADKGYQGHFTDIDVKTPIKKHSTNSKLSSFQRKLCLTPSTFISCSSPYSFPFNSSLSSSSASTSSASSPSLASSFSLETSSSSCSPSASSTISDDISSSTSFESAEVIYSSDSSFNSLNSEISTTSSAVSCSASEMPQSFSLSSISNSSSAFLPLSKSSFTNQNQSPSPSSLFSPSSSVHLASLTSSNPRSPSSILNSSFSLAFSPVPNSCSQNSTNTYFITSSSNNNTIHPCASHPPLPSSNASNSMTSSTCNKSQSQDRMEKSIENFNKSLAKFRIPVEWFFGRLKKLWLRLSDKNTGGKQNIDADAKIACWLTNIVIECNSLEPADGVFYRKATEYSI